MRDTSHRHPSMHLSLLGEIMITKAADIHSIEKVLQYFFFHLDLLVSARSDQGWTGRRTEVLGPLTVASSDYGSVPRNVLVLSYNLLPAIAPRDLLAPRTTREPLHLTMTTYTLSSASESHKNRDVLKENVRHSGTPPSVTMSEYER